MNDEIRKLLICVIRIRDTIEELDSLESNRSAEMRELRQLLKELLDIAGRLEEP